jgi:hypothetical protein
MGSCGKLGECDCADAWSQVGVVAGHRRGDSVTIQSFKSMTAEVSNRTLGLVPEVNVGARPWGSCLIGWRQLIQTLPASSCDPVMWPNEWLMYQLDCSSSVS